MKKIWGTLGFNGLVIALLSGSAFAQTSVVCSDSDKGKNLAVKGELELKFYQDKKLVKEQSYTDFFSGSRNRYLEFYCNGSKPAYEVIACPNETLGAQCPVIERLAAEPKIQVSLGDPIFPEIITAGATDVPVLNFNLTAYDGTVDLKGLHFVLEDPTSNSRDVVTLNEIQTADLYHFELYDGAGSLITQTKSHAGRVHFDLDSEDFELAGSNDFTVKVDLTAFEAVEDSWRWFRLSLDKDYQGHGVQGVSTESGNLVEGVVLGQIGAWPSSELFVNAATRIAVKHAANQPKKAAPSVGGKEFYRFTVEADRAGTAEIEQLSFEVTLEGMEFEGNVQGRVFKVNQNETIDYQDSVADEVTVTLDKGSNTTATVKVDFKNQLILPGQANTYALFLNRTRAVTDLENTSYAFDILSDTQKSTTREARLLKTASHIVWSDLPGYDNSLRYMRGFLTTVDGASQVFFDS